MLNDAEIGRLAGEALRELRMEGWRCDVEPALASPTSSARQLRLYDPSGNDYAVVVDFQTAGGDGPGFKDEIKRQLEVLRKSL